jgi:hypothetical protein
MKVSKIPPPTPPPVWVIELTDEEKDFLWNILSWFGTWAYGNTPAKDFAKKLAGGLK